MIYSFVGGDAGEYRIVSMTTVTGAALPPASRLRIERGYAAGDGARWCLRGATSYERYVNAGEQERLQSVQPALGRADTSCAALIPITKTAHWWRLPQDTRRRIFEEQSAHIATGLKYLPAIARRLHHGRDLNEPFDFLTWFEYAPHHAGEFEELVAILRGSEEWKYVEREVDVRLVREG